MEALPEFDTSTIMEEDPKNFSGGAKKEELIKRGYDQGFSPKADNVYIGKHLSTIRLNVTPERVAEYVLRGAEPHASERHVLAKLPRRASRGDKQSLSVQL